MHNALADNSVVYHCDPDHRASQKLAFVGIQKDFTERIIFYNPAFGGVNFCPSFWERTQSRSWRDVLDDPVRNESSRLYVDKVAAKILVHELAHTLPISKDKASTYHQPSKAARQTSKD